jgi:hypothetical protein
MTTTRKTASEFGQAYENGQQDARKAIAGRKRPHRFLAAAYKRAQATSQLLERTGQTGGTRDGYNAGYSYEIVEAMAELKIAPFDKD